MDELINLIKNYGDSCEWVGYHRIVGVSEDDPTRVGCEERRDEDFAKIQRHLTNQCTRRGEA